MKRVVWTLAVSVLGVWSWGCYLPGALYSSAAQAKEAMDATERIDAPIDEVWAATREAIEELEIEVGEASFDGRYGLIEGSYGQLEFIRVHVERVSERVTLVGAQARTAPVPRGSGGIDQDFARSIIDRMTHTPRVNQ